MTAALDIALALLVLGLAFWTIVARGAFAAVAGFIAYGLLLSLVWLRLQAVDVALMEAAIGGGLTGVLLITAVARMRAAGVRVTEPKPAPAIRLLAATVSVAVAGMLMVAVLALPEPSPSLAPAALANLPATGVENPVTAVLMAFRALDTLLEAIVLLFAVIGVWSIAPDRAWGGRPGLAYRADPNGTLAFIARVIAPIGLLTGLYVFWVGADLPGGKFQGATIIAAMWLLAIMAGLADTPLIRGALLRVALVAGAVAFILTGFVGVLTADAFLAYPEAFAKPLILVIEFALLPSLIVTLVLLMAGAPARAVQS